MKNYPLYSADRYRDFAELIEGLGKKYAKNRALVWYTRSREEKSVTFGQMAKDVEALKEAFIRKGLAGKHLAIVGENSYQWLLAYMAATGCGSVAVCIDIEQSDETIMQMLRAADAAAAFAAPPYLEICRKALEGKGEVLRLHGKGTETSLSDWVQEGAEQIAQPSVQVQPPLHRVVARERPYLDDEPVILEAHHGQASGLKSNSSCLYCAFQS